MKPDEKQEYIQEVRRTAQHLGLPSLGPSADDAIVEYCRQQVSRLVAEHGLPSTTDQLLDMVASCLDVEVVEVRSDEDMKDLLERVPPSVEPVMARVQAELNDKTDAITLRRANPKPWERRYLAVINCQGRHDFRRYFSKWHELTHRLLEGEQLALAFRQTPLDRKDPGELLVDKVAGELAFFADIVAPRAQQCLRESGLTFESVEDLRRSVAPHASRQTTTRALMRHFDRPAWNLRCAVSLNVSEARRASRRNGTGVFIPKLRVQEVYANDRASASGVRIHQWMRVPRSSAIAHAHSSGIAWSGFERLEEWETSTGGPIGVAQLFVDARVVGDEVWALVSVADD